MSTLASNGASAPRLYRIAILAMGGEGGGVLADWLVHLAEAHGFVAQTTSVPGVAQRTGATIYYVECVAADPRGRHPVLSLMPVPGEVDLVVASELMEAGRALQRGLVTPQLTTLIASTHRVYAMTEKIALGDGRVDADALLQACRRQARQFIGADFARLAEDKGSVVGACLFGAIAASGVLPFVKAQFESAVRDSGVGVASSLAAFEAAYQQAQPGPAAQGTVPALSPEAALAKLGPRLQPLAAQVRQFPASAIATLVEGVLKLADYQDEAYAADYLQRLSGLRPQLSPHDDLLESLARGLALWMSYEDIVRVADLKIRATRFRKVAQEVRLEQGQMLEIREYLHPRIEEIADSLPAGLGRFLLRSRLAQALLRPLLGEGKVLESSSLRGFLQLYLLAAARPLRRGSLRFAHESQAMQGWIDTICMLARDNPALAHALADAQRLIKGYSDTQQRGRAHFAIVLAAAGALRAAPDGAHRLRTLMQAALADEEGTALGQALAAQGLTAQGLTGQELTGS